MLASQRTGSEVPMLVLVIGTFAFDSSTVMRISAHPISFMVWVFMVQMCPSYKQSTHAKGMNLLWMMLKLQIILWTPCYQNRVLKLSWWSFSWLTCSCRRKVIDKLSPILEKGRNFKPPCFCGFKLFWTLAEVVLLIAWAWSVSCGKQQTSAE